MFYSEEFSYKNYLIYFIPVFNIRKVSDVVTMKDTLKTEYLKKSNLNSFISPNIKY